MSEDVSVVMRTFSPGLTHMISSMSLRAPTIASKERYSLCDSILLVTSMVVPLSRDSGDSPRWSGGASTEDAADRRDCVTGDEASTDEGELFFGLRALDAAHDDPGE